MPHEPDDTHAELRAAFQAFVEHGEVDPEVSPEAVWGTADGSLPAARRREVIDHLTRHPGGLRVLRLAWESSGSRWLPQRGDATWVRYLSLSAAAIVLMVGGAYGERFFRDRVDPRSAPTYRSSETRSLLAAQSPVLTGDGSLELRWFGAPDGSRFDVQVTTEELETITSTTGLEQPLFRLRGATVSALRGMERFLYQVTVHSPDGEVEVSSTFVGTVEP